jgi:hypothetical protein
MLKPLACIRISPPQWMFEFAALVVLWAVFISLWAQPPANTLQVGLDTQPLVDLLFSPAIRQPGLEHERLAGVILAAEIGLKRYGHIPAWNPYIGNGEPLINNPFNYLFNPFHSLPVLLLGGVQGSKWATFLAVLIAGCNAWLLARALGLGGVGRVLVGALYMLSGGIAGKFYAGHFQLALSLAWPPLVLAGLWWTLCSTDRRAPILMAVAFALLFCAGNIYYALHTLLCCVVIVAVHLVERAERWQFRWERLRRASIGGMFAFGLAALQFMPIWFTRDFVNHERQEFDPHTGAIAGNYSFGQTLTNLTYPWPGWSAFEGQPFGRFVAVDYAYIGPAVFVFIAAGGVIRLAAPGQRRHFRGALAALLLALLMMAWAGGQAPILRELYARFPLLAEFRFIGRALAIAALWWIVLAGIAADTLWRAARNLLNPTGYAEDRRLIRPLLAAGVVWLYLLGYSLAPTSTRQVMVLYNFGLLNALDSIRFSTVMEAAQGLWALLLAALLIDVALFTLRNWIGGRGWQPTGASLLQIGVLALALAAISDLMQANRLLYLFQNPTGSFSALYPYINAHDTAARFPAIRLTHSPLAFETYAAELRNWLDEGWRPYPVKGIIPVEAGALPDLPRWAVVSNLYGEQGQGFSSQFVADNGYVRRECRSLSVVTIDPCDLSKQQAALLYELPTALPYTFIAPADQLLQAPKRLNADNVLPATLLDHQQDTITIRAAMPSTDAAYYLIVRETHFPGWRAWVDATPVPTFTAQTDQTERYYAGFIAIPMQPGKHTYTLRFEPPGFTTGVVIFLITLVTIGLYWRGGRREQAVVGRVVTGSGFRHHSHAFWR